MSRSCGSCVFFQKRKDFVGRIGICEFEDGSLEKDIKSCDNYKGKKYNREKANQRSRGYGRSSNLYVWTPRVGSRN